MLIKLSGLWHMDLLAPPPPSIPNQWLPPFTQSKRTRTSKPVSQIALLLLFNSTSAWSAPVSGLLTSQRQQYPHWLLLFSTRILTSDEYLASLAKLTHFLASKSSHSTALCMLLSLNTSIPGPKPTTFLFPLKKNAEKKKCRKKEDFHPPLHSASVSLHWYRVSQLSL